MCLSTQSFFNKGASLPLLFVGFIVIVTLLIEGPVVFSTVWPEFQSTVLIYLVLLVVTAVLLMYSGFGDDLRMPFFTAIPTFVVVFLATGFFLGIFISPPVEKYTLQYEVLEIVFQIFVVSLVEELFFRGLIYKYSNWWIQGIIFGLYHYAAYYSEGYTGFAGVEAILIAMLFGITMGAIIHFGFKDNLKHGIPVTWGIHAAYNIAFATGLFSLAVLI